MATTYFDVIAVGTQWTTTVAGHVQAWYYPTRDQALNEAIDAARSLWKSSGFRSVVRLQREDGEWESKRSFGDATPAPTPRLHQQGLPQT